MSDNLIIKGPHARMKVEAMSEYKYSVGQELVFDAITKCVRPKIKGKPRLWCDVVVCVITLPVPPQTALTIQTTPTLRGGIAR